MVTHDSGAQGFSGPGSNRLTAAIFRINHKTIGLRYLWLALFSVFVGMTTSLIMRLELVWPAAHLSLFSHFGSVPNRFAALTLLHGSLMVFMVLTTAPQAGFATYLLPSQIGARDVAFPRLSALAFWATVISMLAMVAAFFLTPAASINVWIASVAVFYAAALLVAVNLGVTVIDLRAKGLTLPRLPVTVWAWCVNAILGMLIFSSLLAVCVCLLADRFLGTGIFGAWAFLAPLSTYSQPSGLIAEWQRLFWFFAQAQVYLAMIPCFGLVTHVLATLTRRPVWTYRAVVLAICGFGVLGFCIWGEHLFVNGLNPNASLMFSRLAAALGFPAIIFVVSWFGTLWGAKIRATTPMLFTLGFISLFLSGGLSGLILARHDLQSTSARGDFVAGHFHLVMGVAAAFAMLAALFFWFPKMFGRLLDERLGKLHFWITFAGVYCVFMPMHWVGLIANSDVTPQNQAVTLATESFLGAFVTVAILFTTAAQTFFAANVVRSLRRSAQLAEPNPWRATTLEWACPSFLPQEGLVSRETVVYRGAYEFGAEDCGGDAAADFFPQHVPVDVAKSTARHVGPRVRGESAPPSSQPAGAG
jgi:cytochrome c oxidase subunit 1